MISSAVWLFQNFVFLPFILSGILLVELFSAEFYKNYFCENICYVFAI